MKSKWRRTNSISHQVQLCVLASDCFVNIIWNCFRSINSSLLHFGQKRRKLWRTVSSRTHTRVFLWQYGHSSHCPCFSITITCSFVGAEMSVILRILLLSVLFWFPWLYRCHEEKILKNPLPNRVHYDLCQFHMLLSLIKILSNYIIFSFLIMSRE